MLCDKRVLLLDGAPQFKGLNKDVVSNRVFSINEGTVNLMKSIDAWDTICSIRCQPIKQMQVRKLLYKRNRNDFVNRRGTWHCKLT